MDESREHKILMNLQFLQVQNKSLNKRLQELENKVAILIKKVENQRQRKKG